MLNCDLVVIGGGASGLQAALVARKAGIEKVLIIERENQLGGILNLCIHAGFFSENLKEKITGPEYATFLIDKVKDQGIQYKTSTTVLKIDDEKQILAVNGEEGIIEISAKAIILAMGAREMPSQVINIPGSSLAGIYTAATAERFVNNLGFLPGKEVVILGSGNLGLILARRLTIEGAIIKYVVETKFDLYGSIENYSNCLEDFKIPLVLNHTIVGIKGKHRIEGITIVAMDKNNKPIKGTEKKVRCDALILNADLVPENEILFDSGIEISNIDKNIETNTKGIFACGNVLDIRYNIEDIIKEAKATGEAVAKYII